MKKFLSIYLLFVILLIPSQAFGKVAAPILVYHSIDEFHGHGSKELYVTPENFEKQMTFLKNQGYTFLTFERWKDLHKVKKPIFITIDDGYQNNKNILPVFQRLQDDHFHPTATLFIISDFIGGPKRLSKSELRELSETGFFSIQSHTATHPDLTKPTNYEYELKKSKLKIETLTGKPVIALSYPFGAFNLQVVAETKKYYQFGLTTTPGLFIEKGEQNETYLLPRIYVKYSTTIDDFANLIR